MQNKKNIRLFAALGAILAVVAVIFFVRTNKPQESGEEQSMVLSDPFGGLFAPADADEATRARFEEMITQTKAMYEEAPDDWESWLAVGNLRSTLGDPQGAISAYQKANELNPINIVASNNIAEVYRNQLNDYENAARYYMLAINNNLRDATLYLKLSKLYEQKLGDMAQAEEWLVKGIERNGRDADLLFALVSLYGKTGNLEKQKEYARVLLQTHSDNDLYRQKWGYLLEN